MLSPPPLKSALYYPVTSSVGVAAIAATLLSWTGQPVDVLVMNSDVWDKWQIWRALTATLLHVGFFHLAFNLYWLWVFGALVERVFGHVRCAGIFVLLAFASMLAEFTFLSGGVGLSGVGYGLWGMLWVMEKRDARFWGAVDDQTSRMFVGWFFLCVILTATGVMPVANIAHGVGALAGVLLGLAISGQPSVKMKSSAGLATVIILAFLGATVFWPSANFSASAEAEVEQAAAGALNHNNTAHAVKLLEFAVRMKHAPARAWYNLGVAYSHAKRYDDAVMAYEHAAGMPDADSKMREIAQHLRDYSDPAITNR